jgi:hypothetical protein
MPRGISSRRRRAAKSSQSSRSDVTIFRSSLNSAPSGESEVITRILTKEATITSSGGGTIAVIATWDASTFGDFSTLAPLYDEWRPIGMRVVVQCQQAFAPPATALSRMVVLVFDNDDASTALTSYANALDYHVKKIFPSVWDNSPLVRMSATALSIADSSTGTQWQTTATTAPLGGGKSFKYYSTGLTASTNYLEATYEYVVQFRQPT